MAAWEGYVRRLARRKNLDVAFDAVRSGQMNLTQAAAHYGVNTSTLWYRLKRIKEKEAQEDKEGGKDIKMEQATNDEDISQPTDLSDMSQPTDLSESSINNREMLIGHSTL